MRTPRRFKTAAAIGYAAGRGYATGRDTPMDEYIGSDSDHDEDGGLLGGLRAAGARPGLRAPDLGDDLLAVLARKRTPEERAAILRTQQIDLNSETHGDLDDLEDASLLEHMREAREARDAAAAAAHRAAGPDPAGEVALRRAMSAMVTGLTDQLMAIRCACDDVHAQAASAGQLAEHRRPHGYPMYGSGLGVGRGAGGGPPPSPELAACLRHLKSKLDAIAQALAGSVEGLAALERHLTLARREHEALAEALRAESQRRRGGGGPSADRGDDVVHG